MRVALGLLRVVPIDRHEEGVDMGLAGPDRLLLDAADPRHRSVELDLAGRGDLQPVVDVAAALLEDLERKREADQRTAHLALQVEVDRKRKPGLDELDGGEADERPARDLIVCDRADPKVEALRTSAHADPDDVAGLVSGERPEQVEPAADLTAVRGDDDVVRAQPAARVRVRLDRPDPNARL